MLAAALALASAIVYGAGDFVGGMATRVSRAESVVLLSQVVGLLTVLVAIAVTGGRLDLATLAWARRPEWLGSSRSRSSTAHWPAARCR